ncbi:M1 family metallopeptidase [Marinigracilibium pacificum]|uniref:M1 family metallopeptidase n=1 Tax=Marinigracilibium pacificum TaxID=2729599 RepID=A0A848J4L1_9BACT|nr:M1 family metallopeptidase [Marinigracilibium pacificum]NMM49450.1 M1 family metallopeptidase [Marinigracilibium pacificum]
MCKKIFLTGFYAVVILAIFSCSNSTPQVSDVEGDTDSLLIEEQAALTPKPVPYQTARPLEFDIIHLDLNVSFDFDNEKVFGKATITGSPYSYPLNEVILDGKGFEIKKVTMPGRNQNTPVAYDYDSFQLKIHLDRFYQPGEIVTIEIDYIADPNNSPLDNATSYYDSRGLYFVKDDSGKVIQLWTQGEPENNSRWFPLIDAPNERFKQEISISVPSDFETLSNGLLISSVVGEDSIKTDTWRLEQAHAAYLTMIAAGKFAKVEAMNNDLSLQYFVEEKYKNRASDIFKNTPEMIDFLDSLLDEPFPWPKYAQIAVRDFVTGAMENTTASVFMEEVQLTENESLDEEYEGIVMHELAHQWFGDLLTAESWANIAMNESFANYSEYLWAEHKYGEMEAGLIAYEEEEGYFEEALEETHALINHNFYSPDDVFDAHSYNKGGRILHMLRAYLGDDVFFKGIQNYIDDYKGKSVEAANFRLSMEAASGQDLSWFFNQWFYSEGHPELTFSYLHQNDTLYIEVFQVQSEDIPVFVLPATIDVFDKGQGSRYTVTIDKPYQILEIPMTSAPETVIFDPEHELLVEIAYEKPLKDWINQYKYGVSYKSKFEALEQLSDSLNIPEVSDLFLEVLSDNFWAFRQYSLNIWATTEGDVPEEVIAKVASMAASDSNYIVRADAIATIGSWDPDSYKSVIEKGLESNSFSVKGASIEALSMSDIEGKYEKLQKYESYNQIETVIPLALYYLDSGYFEKISWLEEKIINLRRDERFYALQLYMMFLPRASESVDLESKSEFLFSLLEKEKSVNNRTTIYLLLMMLEDYPGVKEKIEKKLLEEKYPEVIENLEAVTVSSEE